MSERAASPQSPPSQELRQLIQKVSGGATLTQDEIHSALEQMTAGAATPAQMGAFLMALRRRGETVEEITGAARMMRARMNGVTVPADAIDIVGTGGDSHGTYNISTCAALVRRRLFDIVGHRNTKGAPPRRRGLGRAPPSPPIRNYPPPAPAYPQNHSRPALASSETTRWLGSLASFPGPVSPT